MRLSNQLFTKTRKDAPADESAKNAQLLIKAGYIHKEMAGVYSFLPLGLKVLNNIVQVIREEMNDIGGQEVFLTAIQSKDLWEKTDRWSDDRVDNWFKTNLHSGTEVGLGFTHEEPITNMMKNYINSYKDLPVFAYQFQTKFRNELRSKSGLMRGREFLMKDLYSFSLNQEEHDKFYENAGDAYMKVFNRLGIGGFTYKTFASGGSFSQFSHEFQTISDVGEDTIYVDEEKKIAVNKEVFNDEVLDQLGLDKNKLKEQTAVEVGNIFTLGTRFSEPLGLTFTDENGQNKEVIMGSYGIGPSRLVGLLAEHFSDERGLVWPMNVAPAQVYIARLDHGDEVVKEADKLYENLQKEGTEVIYDDRELRPGEKFADADLLGIPYRVVVSNKTLEQGKFEVKQRTEKEAKFVEFDGILKFLAGN